MDISNHWVEIICAWVEKFLCVKPWNMNFLCYLFIYRKSIIIFNWKNIFWFKVILFIVSEFLWHSVRLARRMVCFRNQISLCNFFLLYWLLILLSNQSYWNSISLNFSGWLNFFLWGGFSFSKFDRSRLILVSIKITFLIFSFLFLRLSFNFCHSIPKLSTKITYCLDRNINDGNNFQN